MRANVQTLIALFTHWFFIFQIILSDLQTYENGRKSGFNSVIDRQIRAGIPLEMLPPFGPDLTPFRPAKRTPYPPGLAPNPNRKLENPGSIIYNTIMKKIDLYPIAGNSSHTHRSRTRQKPLNHNNQRNNED